MWRRLQTDDTRKNTPYRLTIHSGRIALLWVSIFLGWNSHLWKEWELQYLPCTQMKELKRSQKSFPLELMVKIRQLIIIKTFHVDITQLPIDASALWYSTPQKIIWMVPVEACGLCSKHTALTKQFWNTPWIS